MTRFQVQTLPAARRSLARLVREYYFGNVEEARYRGTVYGLNALLAYYRLDAELSLETRLSAIEAAIGGKR
jgi:hypothetical protein